MSAAVPVIADGTSFERVEAALGDRVASRTGQDQLYARCPVEAGHSHGDRSPSLSVTWRLDRSGGGRTFVHCQRGCDVRDVLAAVGLGLTHLYDTPPAHPNGQRSTWSPPKRSPKPAKKKTAGASSSAGRGRLERPEPVASYVYTDVDGVRVFAVDRYEVTEDWPFKYGCLTFTADGVRVARREAPKPGRRCLYRLPAVAAAIAAGEPVYVVEGEKDADSAAGAGLAATTNAFGACDTPGRAEKNWLPQYTESLRGAHVVVVADNDGPGYRHAAHVAASVAEAAATVRVVRTPLERPGADLSDHLAAGLSVEDLTPLEVGELPALAEAAGSAAAEVDPVEASAAAEPAGSSTASADAVVYPFPDRGEGRGGRGGSDGGGGAGGSGGGSEPEWQRVIVRDLFEANKTGLFKIKREVKDGTRREVLTELLPVRVRLTGRVAEELNDGSEPELTHVDLVADRDGEEVTLPSVSRRRWDSCSWVDELPWPAHHDDTPRGRSLLRAAIMSTSGPVPLTTMYGTLGWQEIGGRWRYVHAGGVLDESGPVDGIRVNVPAPLAPFALPTPPTTPAEVRSAVLASTAILDVMPGRLAAPLLGACYRACLGPVRVTLMPVGGRAGGKTGLAALAAQHYAPSARYNALPGAGAGEAAGTTVGLEELRFRAGDMVLPLDDLAPDRGTERASIRAAEIARSQFNRTGKVRSTREGGLRPVHPPRSLPLVTGEEGTTVESADSRIVSLRVARGDVDIDTALPLLDSGSEPELRAQLTAAMVTHYAPVMPMTGWLESTASELRAALRNPETEDPGLDNRHAESVSELAAGWRAMLDMAVARGALTAAEAAELWERAWAGLVECKRQLMAGTASRTAPAKVRELLTSLLTRRDVALLSRDGGMPEQPSACGWSDEGSGTELLGWRIRGAVVGWTDGERVWLQPGAVFPQLDRQASAEHDPLGYTRQGLGGALADAGVIRTRNRKGVRITTVPVRLGKDRNPVEVWEFAHSWLFPAGDDDDAPAPSAPTPPAPAPVPPTDQPTSPPPADMPNVPAATPSGEASSGDAERDSGPSSPVREPSGPADPDGGDTGRSGPRKWHTKSARRGWASSRFEGLAVVCEPSYGWMARPGEEPARLDLPGEKAVSLLEWLAGLRLGHVDGRGTYRSAPWATGQAWITSELRKLLRWPASLDTCSAADRGKITRAVKAAGWVVDGELQPWTRLRREDGQRLMLVVPDWLTTPTPFDEGEVSAQTLARRLAIYADATGMAFQWSPAVTGVQLAAVTRPSLLQRPKKLKKAPSLPPPVKRSNRETDYDVQRAPTPDETKLKYAHLFDWNALYLGAASSLPLAWGEYEHVTDPVVDLARPGYWKIVAPSWEHSRLFDPFRVWGRGERDTLWITTPTLKIAAELLGMEVEPLEGYLAAEQVPDPTPEEPNRMIKGYGRLLDKWAAELSNGRKRLLGSSNPDEAAVIKIVKATYGHGIGRFDATRNRERNHPLWRPDWRHAVIAQGRYAITRRMLAAADAEDRYPLAILTDGIVYASDSPDPAEALPKGFTLGTSVGQVKHEGCAPMSAVAKLLRTGGDTPARTTYAPDGSVKRYGLSDTLRLGGGE